MTMLSSFFFFLVALACCSCGHRRHYVEAQPTEETEATQSETQLPPGLQTTDVPYLETRATYVPFPAEAQALLEEEMASLRTPLTLEVTTTVTHWQNPLWQLLRGMVHRMRSQNQIVYIRAHYFVGNGLTDTGCRTISLDEDTGATKERAVDSLACQQQCTNHGRYCAPEVPPDWHMSAPPKGMVEETLRRLCIDDLYHATDLHHWEYLDAFSELQCHTQPDVAVCAQSALERVARADWKDVQACMQLSGGLDADTMNVRLQEQLDRQQAPSRQYSLRDVPRLTMAGVDYRGPWDVEHMFDSVCRSFDTTVMTPLACQFCGTCHNVRKCLWYLECDGAPFDMANVGTQNIYAGDNNSNATSAAAQQQQQQQQALTNAPVDIPSGTTAPAIQETPPPTWFEFTDTSTVETLPPAANPQVQVQEPEQSTTAAAGNEGYYDDNDDDENEEELPSNDPTSVHSHAFFVGGILAGLVFGLAPAVLFARDERRIRRKIVTSQAKRAAAAEEGQWADQRYRDDDGDGYGDDDLATSMGASNRPTQEELEELEDVDLANTQHGSSSSRLPPRMSFALHKFVV